MILYRIVVFLGNGLVKKFTFSKCRSKGMVVESIWWSGCNLGGFGKFLDDVWSCQTCSRLDNHGLPWLWTCLLQSNVYCYLWYVVKGPWSPMYTLEEVECHCFEERCNKSKFQRLHGGHCQTNWNVFCIVYGIGYPTMKLIDKEHICFFHWIQSLDKHTKKLIVSEFQDRHKALYYDYKKAKSLEEDDVCYAVICYWWYSFGVAAKGVTHELNNWLSF